MHMAHTSAGQMYGEYDDDDDDQRYSFAYLKIHRLFAMGHIFLDTK